MENLIVLDASNAILGRLASHAAKQALLGKKVIIVNCSEAIVSGSRRNIIKEYQHLRKRGGSSLKGPNFPRESFRIVKRTVRGMLSYQSERGDQALKRVICYNSCPEQYSSLKKQIPIKTLDKTKSVKLSDISRTI